MAFNLVTPPTGGAPLSTNDYDRQNQLIQAMLYSLMQNVCHLTEWDTLNKPEMAQNAYVQHGGAIYLGDSNTAIAGNPAQYTRIYIKVTEAAGVLTFIFVTSAVGYSWNYTYNGFYHADGSQLLPYILYRVPIGDGYYKYNIDTLLDKFDITSRLILTEILDIGIWDMDATASITIAHNIPSNAEKYILDVEIMIINDAYSRYDFRGYNQTIGGDAQSPLYLYADNTNITIIRVAGSFFDGIGYDDNTMNRGYVTVTWFL